MPTPEELLDLIASRAPALRKAGVTELELEGFSIKLAPHVDESVQEAVTAQAPVGALDDPETYGLPPGSDVPGFPALRRREKDERQ